MPSFDRKSSQELILLVEAIESGKLSPHRRGEAKRIIEILKCSERTAYRYLKLLRELDRLYRRIMERRLRRIVGA